MKPAPKTWNVHLSAKKLKSLYGPDDKQTFATIVKGAILGAIDANHFFTERNLLGKASPVAHNSRAVRHGDPFSFLLLSLPVLLPDWVMRPLPKIAMMVE